MGDVFGCGNCVLSSSFPVSSLDKVGADFSPDHEFPYCLSYLVPLPCCSDILDPKPRLDADMVKTLEFTWYTIKCNVDVLNDSVTPLCCSDISGPNPRLGPDMFKTF